MLTSPSGDVTAITSKPLPTEREIAEAVAIANHLHDNIDYSRCRRTEAADGAQRDESKQGVSAPPAGVPDAVIDRIKGKG
jgi:hypothetical protein